jgi:hypothetical protein
MGCNCKKSKLELNIRKKIRQEIKEKIADVKKIWNETKQSQTGNGTVTTKKDELNFK